MPRSTSNQTVFSIQADMGFVAVEILHLLFFFAIFGLDFALVLDPPTSIWVARLFPLILAFLISVRVYVGNAMNAVHDRDRTKLDPALQRNLHNLFQHFLEHLQLAPFHQPLPKDRQRRMVGRSLIHC